MSEFNCSTCRQKFNTFMWCDSCQKQEFENNFKNWTSENDEIDSFIQQTQLKAIDFDQFIQWMPFEGFDILGKVGQGGFATVYEAIWCDGPIWNWNVKSRKWERNDSCRVALKVLEDSKGSTEFLKEISAYVECAALSVLKQTILRCYGISQDPETQDFIMVLEYMPYGNIHLLEAKCDWSTRITILKDILHGLLTIHKKGLIHRDLHAGNILMRNNLSGQESKIAITDIGQNGPPYHTFGTDLYGVMPYISPEVLRGNAYTQSSDIYSLGMIMYELISGVPPFSNRAHDQTLMLDICNGVRPEIKNIDKFPDDFIKILRKCWDPNPFNRPSAHELFLFDNYGELDVKDEKLFKFGHEYELHPGAVYISRDLSIYAQYLSQDEVVEIEWSKGKKLEVYESSCTTKLQSMNDEFGNHFTF